jgi:prevent-host-death family protein
MKSVAISDLRANLLLWIEEVKKGKSILVTSHGKPIARLSPPEDEREAAKVRLKALRKTARIGDILSPIGDDWEND